MSVEVTNVPQSPQLFAQKDMKPGVLYKKAEGCYSTVYTVTLGGDMIWFESGGGNDRIGSGNRKEQASLNCDRYILAPAGTQVLLKA